MSPAYVGVDVGTSMIKAAAFDERGTLLRTASSPARLDRDGVRAEQDAHEVYAAAEEVTARLGADPVLAGVTGQGDGLWLLDDAGRPVRPAVSWIDGRSVGVLAEWTERGVTEQVFRRTGAAMFPGCAAALLSWLDRHEPATLNAATTAACCKDMVFQRLTGIRATDLSDASMPFLDPRTRNYDPIAIEACGLEHRAHLLPPIHDPLPIGEAIGSAALPGGTLVASGPYDLAACALGAGVTEPGDGLLIIGTTLACEVVTASLDVAGEQAGLHLSLAQPGRWLRAMPAMVGTAALDWMLAVTGLRHDEVTGLLDRSRPGANGVTVLPYLAPSGERAPFIEPHARGEVAGVDLNTSRADLVRATCEAIAYAARHCLDAAGLRGELAVCGGGARSAGWLQLFANVLGQPLRVAASETGARGAVLAAAGQLGVALDTEEWTASCGVYEPDPAEVAFYAEGFADYCDRVARARNGWQHRRTERA